MPCSSVSIVYFEQVNAGWVTCIFFRDFYNGSKNTHLLIVLQVSVTLVPAAGAGLALFIGNLPSRTKN